MNNNKNMVTVIIPTLQKDLSVLENLVINLSKDKSVFEIIIIDNSGKGFDFNYDKIRIITPHKNLYVNPSWNLGVKETKTRYFALFNDDLSVCENFCSKVIELLENKMDLGILGMGDNTVTNTTDMSLPQATNFELSDKTDSERPNNWGVIIFGEKDKYNKIPEHIKILCGDDYLRFYAKKQNLKIYHLQNAKISHLGSNTCGAPNFTIMLYKDIMKYSKIDKNFKQTPYYEIAKNGLKKKGVLKQIFSIRNSDDKRHKIIQILGFKISIKK